MHRKPFKLGFRKEPIGMPYCPYMYRWVFNFVFFSIRIHHWLRSDDKRAFHNHPWSFVTIVLKGSYKDVTPEGEEILKFGSCKFRKAGHNHYVEVGDKGCWSIIFTGPANHKWGFTTKEGKFLKKNKYFQLYGHPPCDEK